MKKSKIIYYVSTGLLSLMMLFSASMYFFKNAAIREAFNNLGYPNYIIYPLATAKLLGLIAIWFVNHKWIKEWAYAGFFFNFVLAFFAHVMINDGDQFGALIALALLTISYIFSKKL